MTDSSREKVWAKVASMHLQVAVHEFEKAYEAVERPAELRQALLQLQNEVCKLVGVFEWLAEGIVVFAPHVSKAADGEGPSIGLTQTDEDAHERG